MTIRHEPENGLTYHIITKKTYYFVTIPLSEFNRMESDSRIETIVKRFEKRTGEKVVRLISPTKRIATLYFNPNA